MSVPSAEASQIACSALDTLLALARHQRKCTQCQIDEAWCGTAVAYRTNFDVELRHYAQALKAAA
ncbi:MAG TPA: hypothetical protein VGJ60_20310 [Chloroflexota bacterium]|jgi:hypothetical protein